jgi:hypothetical protein
MARAFVALIATLLLQIGAAQVAAAQATATLESIQTPRGVTQKFILMKPDAPPTAAVILFAGGHGRLGLTSATTMEWGARNFLVRTRAQFVAHGLMVAVVDAPSDRPNGMNAIFRMSQNHAGDIAAVAARLRKEAAAPVWLVGTSMGTFSAAAGAIADRYGGLVLSSTVTRSKPDWAIARSHKDGVASMGLPRVTVPALIVHHKSDACDLTPPADVDKLRARLSGSRRLEVAMIAGGLPPQSGPCEALSPHGFFGVESEAVDAIARFITAPVSPSR